MTTHFHVQKGELVVLDGVPFENLVRTSEGGLVLKNPYTGDTRTVPAAELTAAYESGDIEFGADPSLPERERGAGDRTFTDLPKHLQDEAYRRKAYCDAFLADGGPKSEQNLRRVIA